ncbi:MAG: GMC family oxidoreductase N-terminal domain-containing protein [Burkholderiaceae bacterium]
MITHTITASILLAEGRATGVQCLQESSRRRIHARREVILSAGAFGSTPAVAALGHRPDARTAAPWHRSQVCAARRRLNLQDHIDYVQTYRTTSDSATFGISPPGVVRIARFSNGDADAPA